MSEDPVEFSIKIEPGDQEDPVDKFKLAIETMKKTMDTHIEFYKIAAKLTRTKYLALCAEGFKEHEALFLCKDNFGK